MLCAKLVENWPGVSREQTENVKSNRQKNGRQTTFDQENSFEIVNVVQVVNR